MDIGSITVKVLACSYRFKQGARAAVSKLLRGLSLCWQLHLLVLLVLHGLGTAVPWSDYFALINTFSGLWERVQFKWEVQKALVNRGNVI